MAGPPVIRWDVCKVLLLFQERSQWLCVDSRSAPAAAGRFFTSASSALTPFICGYLSSCLPFCSLSLCLQWRCLPGGVHLIRAASCRSPAQHSDIQPVLCAGSPTQLQYITYFRQNRSSFIFFFPFNVCVSQQTCTKGTVWFVTLQVCVRIRAVLKMNSSVTKLWSTGASSGELNRKRLTFSQASTAIFPLRFGGKRWTRIITKDVLCGEFQRHIGRRQRKREEVTGLHQRPHKVRQGEFRGPRMRKTRYTAYVRVWK